MLDFGMVGSIPEELKEVLIDLVLAIVKRDNVAVVGYFKKIGFLRYDADTELVARAVGLLLRKPWAPVSILLKPISAVSSRILRHCCTNSLSRYLPSSPLWAGRWEPCTASASASIPISTSWTKPSLTYPRSPARTPESGTPLKKKAPCSLLPAGSAAAGGKGIAPHGKGDLNVKLSLAEWEGSLAANTRAIYYVAAAVVFGFAILTAAYLQVNGFSSEARWALGAALCCLYI